MATFRILSIDGGGIRGIVPATILQEIERRTGKRTSEVFDLVAGTSTDGILALGLTVPDADGKPRYSAEEMLNLYRREGPTIFARPFWRKLRAIGNLFEEKYPHKPIEQVLQNYFGDVRLSQAVRPVLITGYETENRKPVFFTSHDVASGPDRDFLMRHVARATSAAPTYFEPAYIRSITGGKAQSVIDGGVYANNPTLCAVVEAICKLKASLDDITVVSIGTGESFRTLKYEKLRTWGLANWAQPLLDVIFDGVSDTVSFQASSLLNLADRPQRYFRFQGAIEAEHDRLDDASTTNMERLHDLGERILRDESDRLDAVCTMLTDNQRVGTEIPVQGRAALLSGPRNADTRSIRATT